MKLLKILLGLVGVLIIVGLAGGVYLYFNLDAYAKYYASRVASETLRVRVSIGDVDIDLPNKVAVVRDVKIGNPRGFKKPHSLSVDSIRIGLRTASKELIDFDDITVKGTNAYLEVKPEGTNFLVIKNGMKKGESKEAEAVKVIIQKVLMTEMTLHPSVTLIGSQDLDPIKVPNLSLSGIGRKQNGVLAQDAIAQVWGALAGNLNSSAGNAGYLQGLSKDSLKEVGVRQVDQLKSDVENKLKDKINSIFE